MLPAGAADPADSLEVRWITPGPLMPVVREWFVRFPGETETRDDAYLLRPQSQGFTVKLRNGRVLDVKTFLGSPGAIELPFGGRGTLEFWRKWSFSAEDGVPRANGDDLAAGWAVVHKTRICEWFALTRGAAERGDPQVVRTGCAVELAEIFAGAARYVSVGFEARGESKLLRPALEHAARLVFAVPLPSGSGFSFSLHNSQSYAEWLYRARPKAWVACSIADR